MSAVLKESGRMKPPSEASRSPTPSHATLPALERPPATLLDYLAERFPHVGKETWKARIAAGHVTFDDDQPLSLATPYRAGARIRYFREVAAEPEVPFAEEVLFENDHLLVADKPHFLPVTPSGPWVNECLLHRLRRRLGNHDLVVAHRLDRETAGLVLCCKDPAVRGLYGRLFQEGRVEKGYLAVARVTAPPRREPIEVASRLVKGEPWFRMQTVPGPPNARTRVELTAWRDGHGLFRLTPATGKTHQLRVHMAALGFPLVNDRTYPELQPAAPPDFARPLQLLAGGLRFRDPVSGRELSFRSRRRLQWPPGRPQDGASGA